MKTPIVDFVRNYQAEGTAHFHMPGHKGMGPLGCEAWDITEVAGADSLYEASGIIAESERNAASLFGSRQTLFSTEGSSQCIRAMLYLALVNRPAGTPPVVVAARNAHKAFLYAAALLDFTIVWLWPETENHSLCTCPVSPETLEQTLNALDAPPAAVYITSPDYLGNMADISALAEVCHRVGTVLAVDNAHGAYLRFLQPSRHPLDLGADLCCDSAHKTLPVLTGGAYLHISRDAPKIGGAKAALALFGSTSPSYLTLTSLDLCNAALAGDEPERIRTAAGRLGALKQDLLSWGWATVGDEPLKLTLDTAASGWNGLELAKHLRIREVEPEYADGDFCVLMVAPENTPEDLQRLADSLACAIQKAPRSHSALPLAKGEQVLSVREALFTPHETVSAAESLGRICGAPAVACPPAIPIAVSGERIGPEAVALFREYGAETVVVLKERF